jgi:uncharacterized membrane protein
MSTALHLELSTIPANTAARVLTSSIRISGIIAIIRAIESAAAL